MRIDEFSGPAEIDGTLSTVERVRFLLFGFDLAFAEGVSFYETLTIASPLCIEKTLYSPILSQIDVHSPVTTTMTLNSKLGSK